MERRDRDAVAGVWCPSKPGSHEDLELYSDEDIIVRKVSLRSCKHFMCLYSCSCVTVVMLRIVKQQEGEIFWSRTAAFLGGKMLCCV